MLTQNDSQKTNHKNLPNNFDNQLKTILYFISLSYLIVSNDTYLQSFSIFFHYLSSLPLNFSQLECIYN